MSGTKGASTIIIAREDLSIPGAEQDRHGAVSVPCEVEARLFDLLRDHRPDVLVLDLSRTTGRGIEAIARVRARSNVPIIVVADGADPRAADYRVAGAADCLCAPVDIVRLNQSIQHIIRVTADATAFTRPAQSSSAIGFAGLLFHSDRNLVVGPRGIAVRLTTSENDVLSLLCARGRRVCSREELSRALYGARRPSSDRAIDVIVNRLRRKIESIADAGTDVGMLIKTEFRRGYVLVADVARIDAAFAAADADHASDIVRNVA